MDSGHPSHALTIHYPCHHTVTSQQVAASRSGHARIKSHMWIVLGMSLYILWVFLTEFGCLRSYNQTYNVTTQSDYNLAD